MDLDTYIDSSFCGSYYFGHLADRFNGKVQEKMIQLPDKGTFGNIAARVVSPFVGIGALLVSVCLRIVSIVEPIIGILADIGAAIIFRNARPFANIVFRCGHIFRNLAFNPVFIVIDVVKIGLLAGIGGIFAPKIANYFYAS